MKLKQKNTKRKNTKRKNTKRKYNKKGGAAVAMANISGIDPISQSIINLHDNWYCTKSGECHRTMEGIREILKDAEYGIETIAVGIKIVGFVTLYEHITGEHLLFGITAPGHYFFIEIRNFRIRIISLWSEEHGIYDYYETGPYGKFKSISPEFVNSFNKLCSRDDYQIQQALSELFGQEDTNRYNDTVKTLRLDIYRLYPLSAPVHSNLPAYANEGEATENYEM